MNNKINRFHGRALRLDYSDYSSNFDELLNSRQEYPNVCD